jgi:hypothetical protein
VLTVRVEYVLARLTDVEVCKDGPIARWCETL